MTNYNPENFEELKINGAHVLKRKTKLTRAQRRKFNRKIEKLKKSKTI